MVFKIETSEGTRYVIATNGRSAQKHFEEQGLRVNSVTNIEIEDAGASQVLLGGGGR